MWHHTAGKHIDTARSLLPNYTRHIFQLHTFNRTTIHVYLSHLTRLNAMLQLISLRNNFKDAAMSRCPPLESNNNW